MLVSARFQVFSLPARGAFHLSLSVLLHYRSPAVFSLGRWSALLQPEFHVLRPTRVMSRRVASLSPTWLSHPTARFPNTVRLAKRFVTPRDRCGSHLDIPSTPRQKRPQSCTNVVWAKSPFAHHYSGNLIRFLFLRLLRCFTSPGSPRQKAGDWSSTSRVSPFGHLRIYGCLRLPEAFRSLPRPSSAAGAKASPVRP